MLSCVMFDTFICFLCCNFPVSLSSISVSIMQAGRFPNQLLHVNFETWLVSLSCSWEYISPLVSNVLFPACLFIQWAWKWGIYTPPGKAGHMSISLRVIELPYYSRLWVYISWYGKCMLPLPPQSMRPDISVSALPHASQAHLRDICPYYICLPSLDSWISYIRMFCICICGDRGSYFRLFVYDRHLSTWPSANVQRWQRFGFRKKWQHHDCEE